MTSKPASRRVRAMTLTPRSCPSRPGLATTIRCLPGMRASLASGRVAARPDCGAGFRDGCRQRLRSCGRRDRFPAVRTMNISPIRYTWSGDYAIAYQIVGDGPLDLVYMPPWCSNLDWNWQWSHHARFLRRLASFSRLILFDARGWGCSDRCPPGAAPTVDENVQDLMAVLGAVSAHRP